jgi:hypothetical protein
VTYDVLMILCELMLAYCTYLMHMIVNGGF